MDIEEVRMHAGYIAELWFEGEQKQALEEVAATCAENARVAYVVIAYICADLAYSAPYPYAEVTKFADAIAQRTRPS